MSNDRLTEIEERLAALSEELDNELRAMRSASPPNVPVGSVLPYAGAAEAAALPDNWRLCDGAALERAGEFEVLFQKIGTAWGRGDGQTTFNLPDLRGMFLRGADLGAGADPESAARVANRNGGNAGDAVGSSQPDALQSHTHTDLGHTHGASTSVSGRLPTWFGEEVEGGDGALVNGNEGNQGSFDPGFGASTVIQNGFASLGDPVASTAGRVRTGRETRPVNAAVNWIIRVR